MSLPNKPGLYLAKPDPKCTWWPYVVEVYGDIPYLRIRLWNRENDQIQVPNELIDPMKDFIFKEIEE